MNQFLNKNLSIISFIFIPCVYLWHPNWLGIVGIQPYWPLFWLLPWSIIHGSINGLMVGLFLGLSLDAISPGVSFTQIPGLTLCGFWFGRIKVNRNVLLGHLRYGLICSMGSFVCCTLYFLQIVFENLSDNKFLLFYPSIKNILVQVFLTGLFAPLICSKLLTFFNSSKEKTY